MLIKILRDVKIFSSDFCLFHFAPKVNFKENVVLILKLK